MLPGVPSVWARGEGGLRYHLPQRADHLCINCLCRCRQVYLPSGREVKVDCSSASHNVLITLPATDTAGSGLCGGLTPNTPQTFPTGPTRNATCSPHSTGCPFTSTWRSVAFTHYFSSLPNWQAVSLSVCLSVSVTIVFCDDLCTYALFISKPFISV